MMPAATQEKDMEGVSNNRKKPTENIITARGGGGGGEGNNVCDAGRDRNRRSKSNLL